MTVHRVDGEQDHFLRRPGLIPLHFLLWMHALGAAAFFWLQPRGFSVSAPWLEHQVIVPAFFGLSLGTALMSRFRPRAAVFGLGALCGFWSSLGLTAAVVGSGVPATAMGLIAIAALGVLALSLWVSWRFKEPLVLPGGGCILGTALGAAFLVCTWAPPASTRPAGGTLGPFRPLPGAALQERDGVSVRVFGSLVFVEHGEKTICVSPALDFDAVADSGFWTLFQSRESRVRPWKIDRGDPGAIRLLAQGPDLEAEARITHEGGRVTIRCATTLRRELPAHLASVVWVTAPGDAKIGGRRWAPRRRGVPAEFFAFRGGHLEFLRATRDEKGPFETLQSEEPADPVIEFGGWKVQVRGWAAQASREPSPTAGWGVSQGAIERVEDGITWSLASTSVGRGWHTVRTAPGTYLMEIVLSK